MRQRKLILASSSPYRRELLKRLSGDFDSVAPDVDELSFHTGQQSSDDLAHRLAREKARAVFSQYPDAVVIGSDQLVDLDGVVFGKPGTAEVAVSQLMAMSGRSHRLLTAVCVLSPGPQVEFMEETILRMRTLSRREAERYVERDQPLDCAGSYRIESLGIALFEHVQTNDFTAIMGLPLMRLAQILRDFEFEVP